MNEAGGILSPASEELAEFGLAPALKESGVGPEGEVLVDRPSPRLIETQIRGCRPQGRSQSKAGELGINVPQNESEYAKERPVIV